ncbi:MAG TPA: CerR family C-terminal domain-containing protein [Caulobacteraceae bacterium]|nr:CerR family C-terminal domain-containing protein [Caulobacteraceae bacterium]
MVQGGGKAAGRAEKPARSGVQTGYRKGDETRGRILGAALEAFGDAGFRAVTTRQIAQRAGVSLPALQYYFGDKEGLYRACAEAIVERIGQATADVAAAAVAALRANCGRETAREHLRLVLGSLAAFLAGSGQAERWAQFVAGELQDPGPAFEILYARLWRPGAELTAGLIARMTGRDASEPAVRLKAQLLISTLLAFQSGRKQITLRTLGWSKIGEEELAMIIAALNAQIDAIA